MSSGEAVDKLPEAIVGNILSRVECVRDVAAACCTCRTWQGAVKHYLYRITCCFPRSGRNWRRYEDTITAVVRQTTCLRELSVTGGKVHEYSLRAWLQHTKGTLKSFTFLSRTYRDVNVLKKLAHIRNSIEHFKWGNVYTHTELDMVGSNWPSLVSLTLDGQTWGTLTFEHFLLLFSCFDKLESVSSSGIRVTGAPSRFVINLSSSLKTVSMERVSFYHGNASNPEDITLVLRADKLSYLSLKSLSVNKLISVDLKEAKSLQYLIIQDFNIEGLQIGDSLQHLVICNAQIKHLEVQSLTSISDLMLFNERDAPAMWLVYRKITQKASTKLRKLRLPGGLLTFGVQDLATIASRFPELRWLSLYHQDTLFGQCPRKLPVFVQLMDLELYVNSRVTDHERLAGWVFELLRCCPKLKCMSIKLEHREIGRFAEEIEFPCKLASRIRRLSHKRPYQLVLTTKHPKEHHKIFSGTYDYSQGCIEIGGKAQSADCYLQHFCIWLLVLQSVTSACVPS